VVHFYSATNQNTQRLTGTLLLRRSHLFLDCVTGHVEVDETNVQLRMLRAHGVVAMLANYGALNVKFDPDHQKENATNILHAIEKPEKLLWEAFTDPNNINWGSVNTLERIDKVVDLARIAAKTSEKQYYNFFGSLISMSSPTPVSATNLLKDFAKIVQKLLTLDLYGGAYLKDIGDMVNRAKDAKIGTDLTTSQGIPHWKHFDSKLEKACNKLQALAELDEQKCIMAP
jgi:hypothetical protein